MVLHRNWSRSGTGKAETHNHPRWSAVAHLSITVPISSKQINKRTTGYVQPLKTGAQQILFNVLCHRPATLWLTIAGRNEATEHIVRDTSCFGKWSFRASSYTECNLIVSVKMKTMLRNNRHFDQSVASGVLVKSTPPLKMIRGVIKLVQKFNYAAKPWRRRTWMAVVARFQDNDTTDNGIQQRMDERHLCSVVILTDGCFAVAWFIIISPWFMWARTSVVPITDPKRTKCCPSQTRGQWEEKINELLFKHFFILVEI